MGLVFIFLITKVFYYKHNFSTNQNLDIWNSNLKAIVIYRLDAIFYGFILVYCFETYQNYIYKNKSILFLYGFILILLTVIVLPSLGFTIQNHSWYWNICYLPLNSISITIMLPYLYFLKSPSVKINHIIKNISVYSYRMYLIHYTFLLYLMDVLIDFEKLNAYYRIFWLVMYIALIYISSKFLYKYFEKPMTDLRDKYRD